MPWGFRHLMVTGPRCPPDKVAASFDLCTGLWKVWLWRADLGNVNTILRPQRPAAVPPAPSDRKQEVMEEEKPGKPDSWAEEGV